MSPHTKTRQSKNCAFTLVEMLIVLAITVLLAAILLPVFQRVRARSYQAVCQSNLKQLGLAFNQYAADNGRCYPSVYSYGKDVTFRDCIWIDRIMPYAKSVQLFTCPAHPGEEFRSHCNVPPPDDEEGNVYHSNGSYFINTASTNSWRGVHQVRLHSPSSTILLIDAQDENRRGSNDGWIAPGSTWDFDSRDDFTKAGIPDRHDGGNNVLYFDGHVKWRTLDSLIPRGQWRADGRDDLPLPPP